MWANYHTHTTYCDGKHSVAELALAASRQKIAGLGISSHAPLPFERPWSMRAQNLRAYLEEISNTPSEVPLIAGLEVDYIPGVISVLDFWDVIEYSIGSIHFVDQFEDGTHWEIDGSNALFQKGLEEIFHGDVKSLVHRYYALTREMLLQATPSILGHFDKIKIQNVGNQLFKETEDFYQSEIEETLKTIKETQVIVEVNTRGWYQQKTTEPYPSAWILRRLHEMNIPITLSSDAHHLKDLVNHFSEAAVKLLRIGFKNLTILSEGVWTPMPFDEHGIK